MRDAQLVMPKAVSAAMAAWITARRICVQVIFLDSWLDSFMEISVFCQFKMRMEQKEVTELAGRTRGSERRVRVARVP